MAKRPVNQFAVSLILISLGSATSDIVSAQSHPDSQESEHAITELLTRFRSAAENADSDLYFECLHKDGIFFGTDGRERFTIERLKGFLETYFTQGIGWKHEIKQRKVYVGPNNQVGWFEEQTRRENVGPMRTTGVVLKTGDGWKIVQYNVAIVVPNEAVLDVVEIIQKTTEKGNSEKTTEPMSDELRKQVEESFEYVWKKIRDSYWDPELGGVDWQAAYDELNPKLDEAITHNDALSVLNSLVSRMNVSHFSIIPGTAYEALGELNQTGARGGDSGINVRIVGEDVLVVEVTPDSPAEEQGVRPGWIVDAVGDIQVSEKLAEVRKEFEDNPHERVILASAANSRLRGKIGDEITVTFRDGNDESLTRTIKLKPGRGTKVQFGHLPEFRVFVDVKSLNDDIGYFRFNAFMNPIQVMGAYNDFIRDNRDSKGIIIDVRGNGGGNGDIAIGMIGWLMKGEKESLGKVILRKNELDMIVRPRPKPFAEPVVVLIDELSVSAAEFFASGIKDLTDARLIGIRTAGAVLGSQIEKLPTGDGFQFAAANFISIRTGKTLEGVGVTPHLIVEPDRQMLLAGKDPAIEAGIEWINSQQKNKK